MIVARRCLETEKWLRDAVWEVLGYALMGRLPHTFIPVGIRSLNVVGLIKDQYSISCLQLVFVYQVQHRRTVTVVQKCPEGDFWTCVLGQPDGSSKQEALSRRSMQTQRDKWKLHPRWRLRKPHWFHNPIKRCVYVHHFIRMHSLGRAQWRLAAYINWKE